MKKNSKWWKILRGSKFEENSKGLKAKFKNCIATNNLFNHGFKLWKPKLQQLCLFKVVKWSHSINFFNMDTTTTIKYVFGTYWYSKNFVLHTRFFFTFSPEKFRSLLLVYPFKSTYTIDQISRTWFSHHFRLRAINVDPLIVLH